MTRHGRGLHRRCHRGGGANGRLRLNGAVNTEGRALSCKLGTSINVGLVLGLLDGALDMDGFSDGTKDGWKDTPGDSYSIHVGTPELLGLILGWLDS